MIASAAKVLADRYDGAVRGSAPGGDMAAALLMSRHAGAGHAPPDVETLAACGEVLTRLLETWGHLAPRYAEASATALWWRIARSGLRAGRYGVHAMLRARPSFFNEGERFAMHVARDAAFGAAKRVLRR